MLCNVSRNTFSRIVRGFSSHRLVTLNYRSLTVNDPARLRDCATRQMPAENEPPLPTLQ